MKMLGRYWIQLKKAVLKDKMFWLILLICAYGYQTVYAKVAAVLFMFFYWPLAFVLIDYLGERREKH